MKDLKILNVEIFDETQKQLEIEPSEISVLVNFLFKNKKFWLDFQTTNTYDYGAFSRNLRAYETDDFDKLRKEFKSDEDFYTFLDEIKKLSKAQKKWNDYIELNYITDTDNYNGIDANSEINKAKRKI